MSERRPPPDDALLVQALDGAGHGVWDWHIPSGRVYFSEGWAQMLGYTAAELEGTVEDWRSRVHPDDFHAVVPILQLHLRGASDSYQSEHRLRCKDGSFRWILAQGKVVERGEDGLPMRIIGTHTDMSRHRAVRESLQEHQLLLLEAQEVGRMGHWSFDLTNGRIAWSPLVFSIFGRDLALGPPSFDEYRAMIPEADQHLVFTQIEASRQKDRVFEFRHRILTPQGELRHVLCRCRRRCDAAGNPRSMLGTVMDISESVLTMQHLQEANAQAERALRAKSAFLAMMSHEIRTPLNGLLGLLDLLHQTQLDDEQLDFVTAARSASNTLQALLGDALDFTRIEAGNIELNATPFAPHRVAESAAQTIALQAQQKGIGVFCDVERQVPGLLLGDEPRLSQIANNLALNAVKFTEHGEVQILLGGEHLSDDRFHLRLQVIDTGPGIPEEQFSSLFLPYSELLPPGQAAGVGLGLSICKRLATLLGGELRVENQRGGGSLFEFSLDLPVGVASQQLIPLNLGRSILVIEPHARTRASLVHILQSAGYRTLEAHAIPERIPLAQLALVIVDSSLVTEALLQSCRSAPLPVATLILTPLALRHSLPIRGDAVTSKPIQRELFLHAVARLVGDVSGEFFRSEPPAPRPEHILVVEDNLINQKVLSAMLRKMGYRFELAADGRQAIEQIHRQHFDIILMDCFMPVMDGYEATRQIRATESHHHTIIAVTANVLEGDREKCLAAGMDDYLAKPVDSATLALVLERHCLLLAARRAL